MERLVTKILCTHKQPSTSTHIYTYIHTPSYTLKNHWCMYVEKYQQWNIYRNQNLNTYINKETQIHLIIYSHIYKNVHKRISCSKKIAASINKVYKKSSTLTNVQIHSEMASVAEKKKIESVLWVQFLDETIWFGLLGFVAYQPL